VKTLVLAFIAASALASPALAAQSRYAAPQESVSSRTPNLLAEEQKAQYREVFRAIKGGDWAGAAARLDGMGDGPLHNVARAELFLAKGSPEADLPSLLALIARAPELPQAAQLGRLAVTRGATDLPYIAPERDLVSLRGQPHRARPKPVKGDPLAAQLERDLQPYFKADQPLAAEALFMGRQSMLTPDAATQFEHRIAWSYYGVGDVGNARRLADQARMGSGEWALQAEWLAGLAAWRMEDCPAAKDRFTSVALRASDPETVAAGHFWASRAEQKCGDGDVARTRLRSAAQSNETFYGLLAATSLGIGTPPKGALHDYSDAEWRRVADKPNVRAAIALVEIGERNLADTAITHQARIGDSADHDALLHLAADLNLPGTQLWLAHNGPSGTRVNMAARYPEPDWRPIGGWRVDKALAFAHTLQESSFRTQIVSAAGAYGLMQVRPGTAGDIARSRGQGFDRQQLSEPAYNLEYGQTYLESLRDNPATGGLLPKVIAAYDAGPLPVGKWVAPDLEKDPLLYIESIPYWETRGYVPTVLRNYWIYEEKEGRPSPSREALARGLWPRFPGLSGPSAVRLDRKEAPRLAIRIGF
jgi:soluble lytic murein transglycosylase-like protein